MIQKMTNSMDRLPVNKTVVLNSPLQGDNVLTRTGVIDDTSTLLHCILHACEDRYKHYDSEEKKDKVYRLKYRLLDKYSDNWKYTNRSIKCVIKQIKIYIEKVQKHIEYGELMNDTVKKLIDDSKYTEHYKLLFELIKYEDFVRILNSIENCKSVNDITYKVLDDFNRYYNNLIHIKSLDDKRKLFFKNLLNKLLQNIVDMSVSVCSKFYFKNLVSNKDNVHPNDLKMLSDYFDVNIYFLNSKTKLPITFVKDAQSLKRKTIILLSVGNQFEIVGRLLEGNEIERVFQSDDNLIHKIYNFLYNHNKIKKIYPELLKYLKNPLYEDSDIESDVEEDMGAGYEDKSSNNRHKDVLKCKTTL